VVPIHAMKTPTIAISAAFLALIAFAPGASATAATCLYNLSPPLPAVPASGSVSVAAGANSLSGFVPPPLPCGTGLTSTAAPCTQVGGVPVPHTGAPGGNAWCDAVVTGATLPTAPMQCTVYPPAIPGPVVLEGAAAGWDIAGGPFGPDGNLDAADFIAGGTGAGAAYTVIPGVGGTFSVIVYPPWVGAPPSPIALAQLIVYPIVSPPGAPFALTVNVGCA
jgi:hypothetical protein